jgi:hypothetical protein
MPSVCRAFFQTNGVLRSFFWFEMGNDCSVYFGSSNTKVFKTGRAGTSTIEVTGTHIDPQLSGRAMTPTELQGKHSIHGSGVVGLPTRKDELRERYEISAPRDGFEHLPLVAILPMEPSLYPASPKQAKPSDLVLNLEDHPPCPLGLLFYLSNGGPEPPAISAARAEYETFKTISVPIGTSRLFLAAYTHSKRLMAWQKLETTFVAHPGVPGNALNWPFFG